MNRTIRLFALALLALVAAAQVNKSSLTGVVKDASGGAIVGASLKLVNEGTGVTRTDKTDGTGLYRFLLVDNGVYRLEVEQQGFKRFVRTGIDLNTGETTTVDVPLEVGATSDAVTVVAEAAQLRTETSALGSSVGERAITQLPLQGRNPYVYLSLSAGIQYTGTPTDLNPWDVAGPSSFAASGSSARSEFLLDGIPNMRVSDVSFSPSPDAVSEMRAQTNTYDAEYGHSSAAFINVSTKGGTNDLHGTVYWYHQNDNLNARSFFQNLQNTKKSEKKQNTFGFAVGGPVYIPKLVNGRDKLFFFFDYEGTRNPTTSVGAIIIPSVLERGGDFSQTTDKAGKAVTIYDPMTTVASGSGYVRTPFANNFIPDASRDPVGKYVANLFPAPNKAITPGTLENYTTSRYQKFLWNSIATRVDYNISSAHTLFFRVGWNHRTNLIDPFFPDNQIFADQVDIFHRRNLALGMGHTWIKSARTVVDFRMGVTRASESNYMYSEGMDLTKVGFPASFAKAVTYSVFPAMTFTDILLAGGLSRQDPNTLVINQYNPMINVHSIYGRHAVKYGWRYTVAQRNDFRPGRPSGIFNFGKAFTQGPDPTKASALAGNSVAALLLGMPDAGNADIKVAPAFQTPYMAFYVQDDWKLTDRLTLNLGVRIEHEGPTTDRFDNGNSGLDFSAISPIEAAVQANYAKSPIAELQSIKVRGGLGFLNVAGAPRGHLNMPGISLAPRFGLAYRVNRFMVWRAGWGIFYSPNNATSFQQIGSNSNTLMVQSIDNNLTPFHRLSNPFPNGLSLPLGSKGGLLTAVGQSILGASAPIGTVPDFKLGFAQQFSTGFQLVLPGAISLEASYVGNLSQRLTMPQAGSNTTTSGNGRLANEIPDQFLALKNRLNEKVANPFYGVVTDSTSILSKPTVTVQQLLRPYPQFTSINQIALPLGRSNYNSLQVQVGKRLSHGVQFGAAYTLSKYMEATSYLNPNAAKPEHVISGADRPQHLVINGLWELPIGPGKPLLNTTHRVARRIVEGWQVNWISTFQSGQALAFAGADRVSTSSGDPHSVYSWFDTKQFVARQPFTLAVLSSRVADVRGPGFKRLDLTVQKRFTIYERVSMTLQGEFYNLTNTAAFSNPNTSVTNTNFGRITGVFLPARNIQLSARISF